MRKRSDIFYNPEIQDYIRERWVKLEDEEIANQLNKIYGGHITKVHVRVWRVENNLVANKFLCHYHKSIRDFIRENRLQEGKTLKQKIFDELGYDIPYQTVRTNKRRYGYTPPIKALKNTCLKTIKKEFPEWPKDKTCKEFYAHIQKIILEKTGRTVALDTIRHYKNDLKLFKGQVKGIEVRKVVQCQYCDRDINLTCRNPDQKFCSRECVSAWRAKVAQEKHYRTITRKDIEKFIARWSSYARKVQYDNGFGITHYTDIDDAFNEWIYNVPSMIAGIRKSTRNKIDIDMEEYTKNYVGKVAKNCIMRMFKATKKWRAHNKSLEEFIYSTNDSPSGKGNYRPELGEILIKAWREKETL